MFNLVIFCFKDILFSHFLILSTFFSLILFIKIKKHEMNKNDKAIEEFKKYKN